MEAVLGNDRGIRLGADVKAHGRHATAAVDAVRLLAAPAVRISLPLSPLVALDRREDSAVPDERRQLSIDGKGPECRGLSDAAFVTPGLDASRKCDPLVLR